MEDKQIINGFRLVCDWLSDKWRRGRFCFSLWAYSVICLVLCGGMGILFEIFFKRNPDFIANIAITVLSSSWAIAGASSADFIFLEKDNYIRSIPIFICSVILILSVVVFKCSVIWQILAAILTFLVSGAMWFLSNADKIKDIDPQNSIGGNVHKDLSGKTCDAKM